ncbi:hypothetical protein NC661_11205 [Aquibacillus koreensis]|uniref:Uncharacterized protein n=1 Tax=Aquibacillus koreensis TaxID=279446 RepID=A0A9X3WMJ5_9BACI|nr:hypothetical protein [Aquibacillus koreensis]MCT2537717.1 hypothetical protein [Aquibacillus koreensis]MDC3420936.1 hypothetical protein [Aquibacillus koreensis]
MNLEQIYIEKQMVPTIMFLCFELILLPVLFLFFIDLFNSTSLIKRLLIFGLSILVCLGMEWLLLIQDVIVHVNWGLWQSMLGYVTMLVVTIIIHYMFKAILIDEGVVTK